MHRLQYADCMTLTAVCRVHDTVTAVCRMHDTVTAVCRVHDTVTAVCRVHDTVTAVAEIFVAGCVTVRITRSLYVLAISHSCYLFSPLKTTSVRLTNSLQRKYDFLTMERILQKGTFTRGFSSLKNKWAYQT